MKLIQLVLMALLMPLSMMASVWDTEYPQIEQNIQQPTFANRTFLITKYGASTKATAAKNQAAINKTIAACSKAGGGKVVIPAGEWKTGAITLKSNVNLELQKDAKLQFVFDTNLYPNVRTRWEGLDCINYSPCIYAYQAKNIAITGEGVIDGGGNKQTWWPMCGAPRFGWTQEGTPESQKIGRPEIFKMAQDGVAIEKRVMGKGKGLRPQLVNFYQCENILIEGVFMLNSPFWVIHPLLSKNITVRGVKIWNEGPNGDGCDPESCENVLIENCVFHTGDDCIAIKSGRNEDGRKWNIPSRNIIVRGCKMEDGHGGVVVGSEISGGVNNVFVENCEMDSPNLERVLRIKTNSCRGGLTENIYMRNVKVGQCREAVLRINLCYEPKEAAKRGFNPTVRNVYMENVTCQKSRYGILLNGLDDADNIYNINVKNCSFNGVQEDHVKKTGKSHDLHFDNLMINGSLTLDKMPYQHYSEWLAKSEMQRVPESYMLDFSKKPKWSYVMGIELESILDTYLAYKDNSLLDYCKAYPAKMIAKDGTVTGYKYEDFNLDNIRTARFIYRMYQLDPQEGELKALQTMYKQLLKQPRTKEGVWWHKAIYANQVWLDGIFMGLPYYTMAAPQLAKKPKKIYDDALMQITRTFNRTYDAKTDLWKHAWDETHTMFWANKETGLSQHSWARAMGWFTMAMIEVLDVLPQDHPQRPELIKMFNKAMTSVVNYQDKKSGVWYDVLDVKDPKNYLESTASSMFAYCLLKGNRLGYFDGNKKFKAAGLKAYNGILKNFIRVNADKTISLTNCCSVSGLGPAKNPKRDGSFAYYMSEPVRDNDAKGVGPFIWASLEMERMGYNTSSTINVK